MASVTSWSRCCNNVGFDQLITADEPEIHQKDFKKHLGLQIGAIEVDLATVESVDISYAAAKGQPVDALRASEGIGLGGSFLDYGPCPRPSCDRYNISSE